MIPPRTHLRNLAITVLALTLVCLFALRPAPSSVQAQATLFTITQVTDANGNDPIPPADPPTVNAGDLFTIYVRISNASVGYYNVTPSFSGLPQGVTVSNPGQFALENGQTVVLAIQVNTPSTITPGTYTFQTTASGQKTSVGDPAPNSFNISAFARFIVAGATPTPTPSPTLTITPTPTVGPACPEGNRDPADDRAGALLVLVDVEQRFGICHRGDVDWFRFAAIGGKVYTLDILHMDLGLDLSLELYDEDGNRLTANDDFFARTPPPAPTPPRDIRPRIQSWRAPRDGIYYVRVADTANVGGDNLTYTFIINSESYGPTPPTVAEVCADLFEPDGLPEQAKLILSNEIQPRRTLCPDGDADWVRFFGKTGKTYYIYTDTRPYRNNPDFNNQTEAGADTLLVLTDRDGVTLLDFNDDIEGSLDSQIRFVPQADGFYYVQVKNTGDIGNQFIRYDLVLQQCLPDQECGRSPQPVVAPQPTVPGAPTEQPQDTPAPTNTSVIFDTTPTPPTPQTFLAQGDTHLAPLIDGRVVGFADDAFEQVWQRTDRVVAEGSVQRSWLWGPEGGLARAEGYFQAASGLRQVQYFDKGRMEINDPAGDRSSRWFVTSGLLVMEMITGRAQIGDNEYLLRGPADIPVAGDATDPNAPTYASFGAVVMQSAENKVGQLPGETIDRSGTVGTYSGPQRPETRFVHYVPETGHNIPAVFWDFLNARGAVYEGGRLQTGAVIDWLFTLGYPVSEPYWTRVRVGGVERDVLVQMFQRRVLTYLPDNPPGWRVEMGNVGRHYYRWRYGEELP